MVRSPACLLTLLCVLLSTGCTSALHPNCVSNDPKTRWRQSHDYYALLELVDRYIDPDQNGRVPKSEVTKWLGEGIHNPNDYPNAGPNFWVYPSTRPVPYGSYLYVEFGDDGLVKEVSWGSE